MKFIDLHCDTLWASYKQKTDDISEMAGSMVDLKRMKAGGALAQFFAVFMPSPENTRFAWDISKDSDFISHCVKVFNKAMEGPLIAPGLSSSSIEQNEKAGKMSAFLTFEDGRPIDGKIENLEDYYRKGWRLITLTWNGENCFGFPNSKDAEAMQKGLKPFGKEAVKRMNELGVIVDVSHLSDGGFWDVAALSKKPFIASHSNCRALSPHQRNLTDEMIRVLAEHGGVSGLNFAPGFLNADITCKESTAALLSAHARHFIDIGGEDCVALGSDLDGITGNLEIGSVDKMPLLFERFKKDGLSERQIEKIAWKNALRVIKDVL